LDFYTIAIHHAEKAGFRYVQALACECFGLALQRWGDKPKADCFLKRAFDIYRDWGALAVVSFKEEQYNVLASKVQSTQECKTTCSTTAACSTNCK
jgi:hypothetical protein